MTLCSCYKNGGFSRPPFLLIHVFLTSQNWREKTKVALLLGATRQIVQISENNLATAKTHCHARRRFQCVTVTAQNNAKTMVWMRSFRCGRF